MQDNALGPLAIFEISTQKYLSYPPAVSQRENNSEKQENNGNNRNNKKIDNFLSFIRKSVQKYVFVPNFMRIHESIQKIWQF